MPDTPCWPTERKTRGQFYEPRPDPEPGAEVRQEALLIYGTDDWETTDVFNFFGDYRPDFVEWINDSTCMSPCIFLARILVWASNVAVRQ
jgi:hypothetical protein